MGTGPKLRLENSNLASLAQSPLASGDRAHPCRKNRFDQPVSFLKLRNMITVWIFGGEIKSLISTEHFSSPHKAERTSSTAHIEAMAYFQSFFMRGIRSSRLPNTRSKRIHWQLS